MSNFEEHIQDLLTDVRYKPFHGWRLAEDQAHEGGRLYVQTTAMRQDAISRVLSEGRGRKAYLSEHMTDSEIIRLLFGLRLAFEEHECREWFRYKGAQVFGPHIHIDALIEASQHFDFRATP